VQCVCFVCLLAAYLPQYRAPANVSLLLVTSFRAIFPTCPHSQCILQYETVQQSAANGMISSRGWCKDIHHFGLQEIALRCWQVADVVADTNNKVCRGPKSHWCLHMAPVFWRNWHLLLGACVGISSHVCSLAFCVLTDVEMLQTPELERQRGRDL